MSIDAIGGGHARSGARSARRLAATPALALGALVGAGFAIRLAVVFAQATPTFFPDEYIYSALARSLAESGLPTIRGQIAHFPALLEPLLTAPAWLAGDAATSYRLALAIGALAFSLAAVPAYLLARRVGVSQRLSLAVAFLALVVPDGMWTSFLTAEAFAYPLALASVLAGIAALERPTLRDQAGFVLLAGLTTFARVQFVVLFLAYAAAVVAIGLRERRLRRALLEQRLLLGLFALAGAAFAVVGLGYYRGVADASFLSASVLESAGMNTLVLVFAAGVAIVPGAVLGLGLGIGRPADRTELCFALLSLALTVGLLAQSGVYGPSVHERYTFYAVPLLAVAFARWAQRGFPLRGVHALLALALVAGATRVPLTTLGERGESHSPVLIAVHWLRIHVTDSGDASLLALALATVAALAAAAATLRPRAGALVAFALAAAVSLAGLAGSSDFVRRSAEKVRTNLVPADPAWVDHARLGDASLVTAARGDSATAHLQLFYNRSIRRLYALPGGASPDLFASDRLHVGPDGLLTLDGKPLTGPLVVDGKGSLVELQDERPAAAATSWRLYRARGTHRLGLYFDGRAATGWLAPGSVLQLWAPPGRRLTGTLRIPLSLPKVAAASDVTVTVAGRPVRHVHVPAGGRSVVSVPVCGVTHLRVQLRFSRLLQVGDDFAGARAARPVLARGGCGA